MKPLFAALFATGVLVAGAPALAQPQGFPPGPPPGPAFPGQDIRQQVDDLQRRIDDGVRQGQIDPGEHDRAQSELNGIRDEDRRMHMRSGGPLNDMDRGVLQQRIDHLSRSIHWMRDHGPQMAPPAPGERMPPPPLPGGYQPPPPPPGPGPGGWSIDQREDWLQHRIDQGRADGSLSPREARRVQVSLNGIRTRQTRFMHRDFGHLTDAHRAYLESLLDQLSASIRGMRENAPWRQ